MRFQGISQFYLHTPHTSANMGQTYFNICQLVADISGWHIIVQLNITTCSSLWPGLKLAGKARYHIASPFVWNSFPTYLHSTSISCGQFRNGLKIHLFTHAYAWLLWERMLQTLNFKLSGVEPITSSNQTIINFSAAVKAEMQQNKPETV